MQKTTRKAFALLIAVMLLAAALPFSGLAVDHPALSIAAPDEVAVGDTFELTALFTKAQGLQAGVFVLSWDAGALEYLSQASAELPDVVAEGARVGDGEATVAVAIPARYEADELVLATFAFKAVGEAGRVTSIRLAVDRDDVEGVSMPDSAIAALALRASVPAEPTTDEPTTADAPTEVPTAVAPTTAADEPTTVVDESTTAAPTTAAAPTEPAEPTTAQTLTATDAPDVTNAPADSGALQAADQSKIKINDAAKTARIASKTTADAFAQLVTNARIQLVDRDGKLLTGDALVGTGAKVQTLAENGSVLAEYVILVPLDNNGDGRVNSSDARNALRSAAKLELLTGIYADVSDCNGDGKVQSTEARFILRVAAGLETAAL